MYFSISHHSANQSKPSRLVQNIRLRDTSSNNGASGSGLTKDWDFSIEEKEAEFCDDLREASGIGRKRKRVSKLAYARFFAKTPTEKPNRPSPFSTSSLPYWGWKSGVCGQRPP